jgi:hypothetical protein
MVDHPIPLQELNAYMMREEQTECLGQPCYD